MTLFPRGINVVDLNAGLPDEELLDTVDLTASGVVNIVLDKQEAPQIFELPEGAQPKIFGTFDAFTAAIMGNHPTYDLDLETNDHL